MESGGGGEEPTKLDPYKQKIDQWLEEAPYSAVRILEKLQEEGLEGKYSIVKEYVREKKMELDEKATLRFVWDNFMIGGKYNSLVDLNGQAQAWCNKVNGKVHATINEIPFARQTQALPETASEGGRDNITVPLCRIQRKRFQTKEIFRKREKRDGTYGNQ